MYICVTSLYDWTTRSLMWEASQTYACARSLMNVSLLRKSWQTCALAREASQPKLTCFTSFAEVHLLEKHRESKIHRQASRKYTCARSLAQVYLLEKTRGSILARETLRKSTRLHASWKHTSFTSFAVLSMLTREASRKYTSSRSGTIVYLTLLTRLPELCLLERPRGSVLVSAPSITEDHLINKLCASLLASQALQKCMCSTSLAELYLLEKPHECILAQQASRKFTCARSSWK